MTGRLLFLGTGGSLGVPLLGCECSVCHSFSPFNKRLRPSVLITIDNKTFLIDVGPDFRQQALRAGITSLDGVLLTHAHYDHTAGLDELRALYFRNKKILPILLSKETALDIQLRFDYIFKTIHPNEPGKFCFELSILPSQKGKMIFENVRIQYLTYWQGKMAVNGFRFNDLAYLSDIRHFQDSIFQSLEGVKYLIVSALRKTPSPLHFSIDEALNFADRVGAEKVWLTHISHELDHEMTNTYLPSHVRMAYDGLEIVFG